MYELLAKVQINKAETVSSSKRANGRCHAPPYGGGLRLTELIPNWAGMSTKNERAEEIPPTFAEEK